MAVTPNDLDLAPALPTHAFLRARPDLPSLEGHAIALDLRPRARYAHDVTGSPPELLGLALRTLWAPGTARVLLAEPCHPALAQAALSAGHRYLDVGRDQGFQPKAVFLARALEPDGDPSGSGSDAPRVQVLVARTPSFPTGQRWDDELLRDTLAAGAWVVLWDADAHGRTTEALTADGWPERLLVVRPPTDHESLRQDLTAATLLAAPNVLARLARHHASPPRSSVAETSRRRAEVVRRALVDVWPTLEIPVSHGETMLIRAPGIDAQTLAGAFADQGVFVDAPEHWPLRDAVVADLHQGPVRRLRHHELAELMAHHIRRAGEALGALLATLVVLAGLVGCAPAPPSPEAASNAAQPVPTPPGPQTAAEVYEPKPSLEASPEAPPPGVTPRERPPVLVGGCATACRAPERALEGFAVALTRAMPEAPTLDGPAPKAPPDAARFLDTSQLAIDGEPRGASLVAQWQRGELRQRAMAVHALVAEIQAAAGAATLDEGQALAAAHAGAMDVKPRTALGVLAWPGATAPWTVTLATRGREWLVTALDGVGARP